MKLGTYIKSRRLNKDWSQSKLAKEVGVNRSLVSRWESDQSEPTLSNFIKVCEVLGMKLDDFIGKEVE